MFIYEYQPKIHWIPKNLEVAQWLRKRFNDPLLFVFRNMDKDVWCVSRWCDDRDWWIEDIVPLGPTERPNMALTRDRVSRIDYLFNGPVVDIMAMLKQAPKNHINMLQDREDQTTEIKRWMGKKIPYFKDLPWYAKL